MTQRPSQEELELAPLLDSSPDFADTDTMSGQRDSGDFKLDVEKVENRSVRSESVHEVSAAEKRLVRKLDSRIMPLACILYLFACECSYPSLYCAMTRTLWQTWTDPTSEMLGCKAYRRML